MSNMANVHAEYWKTINDLSRDKTQLLERIKRLEDRIHRASMAFFEDVPHCQVASGMLAILEEERGQKP